jgi:hypothetical protein
MKISIAINYGMHDEIIIGGWFYYTAIPKDGCYRIIIFGRELLNTYHL